VDGGGCHRAFTHVKDACAAFQALLDEPARSLNQIYNLGNPENNLTIRAFAELMLEIYKELTGEVAKSELVYISGDEFYGPGYEDADRLTPDVRALCSLGRWPRYDLITTLRDAMSHYLSNRSAVSSMNRTLDADDGTLSIYGRVGTSCGAVEQ
jgi:UDP-apiose/xylose synthase